MGKLKLFETMLKAVSALVAAAMSIVKFLGIVEKLKAAKA